ncbi:MAG: hypothetical protein QXG04_05220, partial [Sulfolobales archaeon]
SLLVRRVKLLLYIASYSFLIVGIALLSFSVAVIITTTVLSITDLLGLELMDLPKIIYFMFSGVISLYGYVELCDIISAVDVGRIEGLKESLLIWGFLGLVFGLVVPGIVTLTVLLRYYGTLIKEITM